MKELKIFAIVVFLSGVLYWGIEPYAHHELHPHTAPANYDFAAEDIELASRNLEVAKAKGDDKAAQKSLDEYKAFWDEIKTIDLSKGDAQKGAEFAATCAGCHSIESAGIPASMDAQTASASFGVVPPDLSTAGAIYDDKFLVALIKNPVMALKLSHKFGDEKPFPMTPYFGENSDIADIVAYLKSVSQDYIKANNGISDDRLFSDACQRCHDIKYDKKYTHSNRVELAKYMGSNPPDLSMMIRAKNSDNYLNKLINDPQKVLAGTSMPRVGLKDDSEKQIVAYLEKIGDSKKDEREQIGIYTMIYFFILGIFATLWKQKVWRELH